MYRASKMILAVALALALVAGLAAGCSSGKAPAQGAEEGYNVGNLATDFRLPDLSGQSVSLSQFRGRPVFLNFWASWCPPCREEMPLIQQIFEDKEWSDKGLVMLAIDIGEDRATVDGFLQSNGLSFPVLLDTRQKVAEQYNVRGIPTTIFIDKDGIIKDLRLGAFVDKSQIVTGLRKIAP